MRYHHPDPGVPAGPADGVRFRAVLIGLSLWTRPFAFPFGLLPVFITFYESRRSLRQGWWIFIKHYGGPLTATPSPLSVPLSDSGDFLHRESSFAGKTEAKKKQSPQTRGGSGEGRAKTVDLCKPFEVKILWKCKGGDRKFLSPPSVSIVYRHADIHLR